MLQRVLDRSVEVDIHQCEGNLLGQLDFTRSFDPEYLGGYNGYNITSDLSAGLDRLNTSSGPPKVNDRQMIALEPLLHRSLVASRGSILMQSPR